MGYKIHAFKGFSWLAMLRLSTRAILFLRLAILARILTPTQFGVFGIATLLLSFLETLTETGINVFLVQRKESILQYLDSAWVISIFRGALISALILVLSPLIVRFFNSPESLNVILLISLVPLIRGFINPSIIKIQKDIEFHKEFYLRLILLVVDAAVTIIVAFVTKSAESMAIGLIISALVEVVLSFVFFKPRPKLTIEINKIKYVIRRSWWVTVSGIFEYVAENGDDIVVGRMLGTSSLGIYQAAYRISTLPIVELTYTVSKVVFPVYSKFSEDKERLLKAFKKVLTTTSLIAIALGIIIYLFSEEIVLIILGDQWLAAIPIVKVLAIYGVLRTIFGNFSPLFLSIERQDFVASTTLVRMIGLVVTIVPFVYYFGLVGAAYSAIASIIIEIPVILYYLRKTFNTI